MDLLALLPWWVCLVLAVLSYAVLSALAYGDAVMIKGSNGVRLWDLVRRIRDRFK